MNKIMMRYKKALEIIIDEPGSGPAWGNLCDIAQYALTGKDFGIDEENKILIDNADKIPVIWGRRNK